MPPETRTKRSHALILALLTVLCATLGWSGSKWGSPQIVNLDEWVYLSQYRTLADKPFVSRTPTRAFAYPDLWMRAAVHVPRAEPAPPVTVEDHLAMATSDIVFLRRCVALLASLIVPATWLLARRFMEPGWSCLAAALAGFSLLQTSFAAQARPHAIGAAAVVLALAAAVDVVRRGTWRASLLAGLACALALAILQSGLAACGPLLVAHLLRLRRDRARAVAHLAAACAIVAVVLVVAYPGVVQEWLLRKPKVDADAGLFASHAVSLSDFAGGGAPIVLRAFWFHDPLLFAVCAASMAAFVVAWTMRRKPLRQHASELVVVLAFALPYALAVCLFQRTYYRFALPLFPVAALFAVLGLRAAGRAGRVGAVVLACVQLAVIVQFARLRVAPDTSRQAARWIARNLDREHARLMMSPIDDLPLMRDALSLASPNNSPPVRFQPWVDYQRTLPAVVLDALGWSMPDFPVRAPKLRRALEADPVGYVRAHSSEYVVLEVFEPGARHVLWQMREAVRLSGQRIASFAPQDDDVEDRHALDPFCSSEGYPHERFVWRLFGASALGPYVEIYRLAH